MDTTHYWKVEYHNYPSATNPGIYCAQNYCYKKIADTIINSKQYSVLNNLGVNNCCFSNGSFSCTLPQINNKAYIIQDTVLKKVWMYDLTNGSHKLLYNFNKRIIGDTVNYIFNSILTTYTVSLYDSVLLNDGVYHKRITYNNNFKIMEGVGSINGFLTPNVPTYNPLTNGYALLCFAKIIAYPNSIQNIYGTACSIITSANEDYVAYYPGKINIYPNPAYEKLNVSLTGSTIEFKMEIINSLGKVIKEEVVRQALQENGNCVSTIDIKELANGIYIIKLSSQDSRYKVTNPTYRQYENSKIISKRFVVAR